MYKRPTQLFYCVILILIFLISYSFLFSSSPFQWQVGEELVYKVNWTFIRLGTLKICVHDTSKIDSTLVYHVRIHVDSNPLLFFVNIHSTYDSRIDQNFRLFHYSAEEKIEGITYKTGYRFNYKDSVIVIEMTDMKNPDRIIKKQEPLDERMLDINTMLFNARAYCHENRSDTVTSFYEGKRGQFLLYFKGWHKKIRIAAINEPMETYYIKGLSKMTGLAGLTGPFEGWFTTDSRRIPLKAKMKVFVGSVAIKLEEWKNWNQIPGPVKKLIKH